jgi:hypothetical protein
METKEIKIQVPEGYKIDMEKSDLSKGIVQFKQIEKVLTYKDVSTRLFKNKVSYWISLYGGIEKEECGLHSSVVADENNSITKEQLESILVLNKLCNAAKYLNGDWFPKKVRYETKWFIGIIFEDAKSDKSYLNIMKHNSVMYSCVYFKTRLLAEQALEILGEEEIRKALTLNH